MAQLTTAEEVILYQAKVAWWTGVVILKGEVYAESIDSNSVARDICLDKHGAAMAEYEAECRRRPEL